MRAAFLLVDCQNDFLNREGLQPAAGALVDRAALLLGAVRAAGSPVLHLRTSVSLDPDTRMPHWRREGRVACLAGSEGQRAPAALRELPGEAVLEKTGFSARDLVQRLSATGAEGVAVAGAMLHACVREAVLALHEAGCAVVVVSDAVASDDPVHAAVTRRYLEARGVRFRTAADLATRWRIGDGDGEGKDGPTVDASVRRAERAGPAWADIAPTDRERPLRGMQERLRADSESLAQEIARTLGKPIRFARVEVARSVEMIDAIVARVVPGLADRHEGGARIRRRPLGTVAVITPWNQAVYLALGKLVPALLCGNAVVWKPAPEAHALAARMVDWLAGAGLPEGVLNLLAGGAETGRRLLETDGIEAASITGSLETGLSAWEACARKGIPLQAELGGNNAAIVWSDADLAAAAAEVAAGAFDLAGQRCTANRRVIVERSAAERFLEALGEAARRLTWGDPLDPETRIGPLVTRAHRERLDALLRRAGEAGATLLRPLGDTPPPVPGHWFPPTVVCGAAPGSEIVQEESFGPVLVVQPVEDWDEAMARCNGVRQGLAAAVFTRCPERIGRFLAEARAGILKINASTADAAVDLPFGGWKASGIGPAEHGDQDLEAYTRLQTVYGCPDGA